MAATGPGGSSPATRRATSCGRRSIGPGWPIARPRRRADDGLTLTDAYIAAAVRCAPPANKPTIEERDACAPFLVRELALLTERARGRRARASSAGTRRSGRSPTLGHAVAAEAAVRARRGGARRAVRAARLVPPSQQNTFTGRLTAPMFDAVVLRAREIAEVTVTQQGLRPRGHGSGSPSGYVQLVDARRTCQARRMPRPCAC